MLYWLLYEQLFRLRNPAVPRVQYITFRTAFASLTRAVSVHLLGPWLIRKLREFQIGQYIREDGPKSHQKKAGTPTMGGVLIIISIVVPTLLWADLRNPYVWIALFGLLSFGAIGFYDDLRQGPQEAESRADRAAEVGDAGAGLPGQSAVILLVLHAKNVY